MSGKKGTTLFDFTVPTGTTLSGELMGLDEDDILGQEGFPELTAHTQRTISNSASFKNSSYFGSDWNYRVKYSIKITPTNNQPNL
ncbi:hypothetical protein [Armatimonas sp.]|uniref:hypothetical protein n=1 Tax=Armatimonas sp. TaxID=1872638 RepID=UPI00374DF05A